MAKTPNALVVLHGFSGSPEDWAPVLEGRPAVAPVLPGHAGSGFTPRSFNDAVRQLLGLLPSGSVDLVGYSLGGRLALGLLNELPVRIHRLMLIAAHVGLDDLESRRARLAEDKARADRLRRDPDGFFESWDALPLFSQDQGGASSEALRAFQERRRRHDASALATALENLSTGAMPDFRPLLQSRAERILLVSGDQDARYMALYTALQREIVGLELERVRGAAHRVLVDAPRALCALIDRWRSDG